MKFLYALEIDQGYLAHSPTGTVVPKKILIVKIKNPTKYVKNSAC